MLKLIRITFLYLILFAILAASIFFYATDDAAKVRDKRLITFQDINRAKQLLIESNATNAVSRSLILTENDVNIAANYFLNRHFDSATRIKLNNAHLTTRISIALPDILFNRYLNISFNLKEQQGQLTPENFIAGQIKVPKIFSGFIIDTIIQLTALHNYYLQAKQHISKIKLTSNHLKVNYHYSPEAFSQILSLLALSVDDDSKIIYQQKLSEIIANHDQEWRLSLAQLLQPLFHLAYQRSTLDSAITENRIAILVINAYVNDREVKRFLPLPSSTAITVPKLSVFLYKRKDMAKHFMWSAALTAAGSSYLADMLAQEKEMADAQQGSGFSFVDLAADRAGMYFGKMATSSPLTARELQRGMAKIEDYTAFMPDVRDLPENLNEKEFKYRFNSTSNPSFQQILTLIDARIAASPVYTEIKKGG
jgi:uncharacterized protein YfiM (DUF2279 family)